MHCSDRKRDVEEFSSASLRQMSPVVLLKPWAATYISNFCVRVAIGLPLMAIEAENPLKSKKFELEEESRFGQEGGWMQWWQEKTQLGKKFTH